MEQRFSKRLRCAKHGGTGAAEGGEMSQAGVIGQLHMPTQGCRSETGCKRQKLTSPPLGQRRELCGLTGSPGLGGLVMSQRPAHLSVQLWNCVCKASLGLCHEGALAVDGPPNPGASLGGSRSEHIYHVLCAVDTDSLVCSSQPASDS